MITTTADGRFRCGGYIFHSYAQALHHAQQLRRAIATPRPPAAASPLTPSTLQPPPAAPAVTYSGEFSEAELRLMEQHDITLPREGGFRARGYIFSSLEQALHWARRGNHAGLAGEAAGPRPAPLQGAPVLPSRSREGFAAGIGGGPSPAPSPKAKRGQKAEWLGQSTIIDVADLSFTTDLVYFGPSNLRAYPSNHSVIDPALKVATWGDPYGTSLDYWPHYAELEPHARRTYLEWLAGGRNDPNLPIGYVFIFFYGLEWRLIHDQSFDETERIVSEVRRLLDVHGANHSFRSYAARLLDAAAILLDHGTAPLEPSLSLRDGYEMSFAARVHLGKKVAHGEPIDAKDGLIWILSAHYLRTPAVRCFEEFKALWDCSYASAHPQGLKVREPKARLQSYYRAASGQFTATLSVENLPDVATIAGPINRLRELVDECTQALDPFSRLLGRQADARGTLTAAALLPPEIRESFGGSGLQSCRAQIENWIAAKEAPQLSKILKVLEIGECASETKVSVTIMRQVAAFLDLLDIGYEPDRRYGATASPTPSTKFVLFAAPGGGKVAYERSDYVAARTMVEIAALAAVSDGLVVPVELEAICNDIASLPGLDDLDRRRLAAHAEALLDDPPKRKEAIKRLAALPQQVRHRIVDAAIGAILADGHVLPAEVRFLEGLHSALGLPQENVYSALHRGAVQEDEPVTVAPEKRTPGIPLPAEPTEGDRRIAIDASRLQRIQSETVAVSELLAGIFVEEESVASKTPTAEPVATRFNGLDASHGELLWRLLHEPLLQQHFEVAARDARLLPAGAIETINEWGFENCDDAILVEDDMIYVQEHLIVELKARGGGV